MSARAGLAMRGTLLLVATACGGAAGEAAAGPASPVPFDALVREVGRLPLGGDDATWAAMPVATLTTADRVVVLDRKRAEMRVFSRGSGALERIAGTPGDGPGQLRKPGAVAALDSGRFVVLDDGRRLLSIRDSLGGVVRERRLPDGSFTSLVALPGEGRVVVAGRLYYGPDSLRRRDLHEFTEAGEHVRSYGEKADVNGLWARAVSGVLVAGGPAWLAIGMLSSNRVRLLDRASGEARWVAVAPGWWVPLDFPADNLLRYGATQQTASARVAAWTRRQRLLNGLFLVGEGRILARFQTFDPSGRRFFHYALSDSPRSRFAVSRPTRVNVLEARGDTLFWIDTHGRSPPSLVTGVVDARAPAGTRVAGIRRR